MTALQLLAKATELGIQLTPAGDQLRVKAPAGVLTAELRDALAERKSELLQVLVPFVTLIGGLTVPQAALELALDLEARGIPLRTDRDHQLVVPDDHSLSVSDREAILRWRLHLGAIAEYRVPEVS